LCLAVEQFVRRKSYREATFTSEKYDFLSENKRKCLETEVIEAGLGQFLVFFFVELIEQRGFVRNAALFFTQTGKDVEFLNFASEIPFVEGFVENRLVESVQLT
jgi:hypothetical protein